MIVSHEHRFIFIKTKKTAGTSIEVALSKIAGNDAIVTPLIPPEPGHAPRNYAGRPRETLSWARANPEGLGRSLLQAARRPRARRRFDYYNHMPAWLVRTKLGDEIWDGYFKFCFERNPWDKMASLYWWLTRDQGVAPPFEEWLLGNPSVKSDWPIYAIDDDCAMDAVGQYATLSDDLSAFLKRTGAPDTLDLPRAKGGVRATQKALFSARASEHVRKVFDREIQAFGYDCPPELLA